MRSSRWALFWKNWGANFAGVICAPANSECQFQKYIYVINVGNTNPPLKPIDSLSVKMKIKKPAFIALISMILSGIGVLGFLEIRNWPVDQRRSLQHQKSEPESDRFASISIGTVLLLLAVGISGALNVRRNKKNNRRSAQKIEPQRISDNRNKAFVRLNKQYLNLQYQITQTKFSGANPPEGLLKEISDLERKVCLISRALE